MEQTTYEQFKQAVKNADDNSWVWWAIWRWLDLDDSQSVDIGKVLSRNKCIRKARAYGKRCYVFPSGAWFRTGLVIIVGTPMAQQFPVKQL